MSVAENLYHIRQSLPEKVTLVAVSKTHPVELIREAMAAGQRVFGENRVQELVAKHQALTPDVQWHMIGHLQTNKVKYIAPFVSLIHSVDSLSLLEEIDRQGAKCRRVIDCLLEMHISMEDTKYGLDRASLQGLLQNPRFLHMKHVRVRGLMGMASFTDEMAQVREEFRTLRRTFQDIRALYFGDKESFDVLSMGMSGDYPVAVEEGSTMVRIGTSIFGSRTP
jgi:pyridoxal phosphate enzyme (YggS family)